jgi:hypothetical protein
MGAIAQQPSGSAEARRREAELMAKRYRLVDQADAAWDREMAREKAGDCNDGGSTYDENMCLGRVVDASKANLKAYVDAFRGIFAIRAIVSAQLEIQSHRINIGRS